jgi:hypothetical protein
VYTLTKLVITAVLVVLVSEIAKRSTLAGGVLASLPLVSVLAMVWLYVDTGDAQRVSQLASSVFWLVLPSLLLFLLLPRLIALGLPFYPSLLVAAAVTAAGYLGLVAALRRLGVQL